MTRSSVTGTDCHWNCTKPYKGWPTGYMPIRAYDEAGTKYTVTSRSVTSASAF